ncbi:hypothetical protein M6B38_406880 [Iris pallida]|uniref:Uncharacterized protein n=1 Tax=Iris pallida TaxID=29817 RepID=A0AAX6FQK6_IRIPA|nr:hypothetical protein M6B38_406880 [Iris pallida]
MKPDLARHGSIRNPLCHGPRIGLTQIFNLISDPTQACYSTWA